MNEPITYSDLLIGIIAIVLVCVATWFAAKYYDKYLQWKRHNYMSRLCQCKNKEIWRESRTGRGVCAKCGRYV